MAYNWTGLYGGFNAGYGWASISNSSLSNPKGFVGGGQLGYNWQSGALVLGVEADLQGTAQKSSDVIAGVTINQKLPYFGTVRGRIGYAADRWLLYVTGGWAYLNYKLDATAGGVTISSDASKSALALGGGVEWAVWDRWSAKLEYLYIDTGNTTVTLFGAPSTGRARDNIARVGLNYHF